MIYTVSVFSGDRQITYESCETKKLAMHSARYWKTRGYTVIMSTRESGERIFYDAKGKKTLDWTTF